MFLIIHTDIRIWWTKSKYCRLQGLMCELNKISFGIHLYDFKQNKQNPKAIGKEKNSTISTSCCVLGRSTRQRSVSPSPAPSSGGRRWDLVTARCWVAVGVEARAGTVPYPLSCKMQPCCVLQGSPEGRAPSHHRPPPCSPPLSPATQRPEMVGVGWDELVGKKAMEERERAEGSFRVSWDSLRAVHQWPRLVLF